MKFVYMILAMLIGFTASYAHASGSGHTICQSPGDSQGHVVCGRGCPMGKTFISWNPRAHPQCSGGAGGDIPSLPVLPGCSKLVNLKKLNYVHGHKTKLCIRNNFDGMTNLPNSSYSANGGGYCYKGDRAICTKSINH